MSERTKLITVSITACDSCSNLRLKVGKTVTAHCKLRDERLIIELPTHPILDHVSIPSWCPLPTAPKNKE